MNRNDLLTEDALEEEIQRATWELTVKYGNVPPNELMRKMLCNILTNCTRWIREIRHPLCFTSRKEYERMMATLKDFNTLPAFLRKWDYYKKLLAVNYMLDHLNASTGKSGKKAEEIESKEGTKKLDKANEIDKAASIILDLVIIILDKRFCAMYYMQSQNRPVQKAHVARRIKVKEIKWAFSALGMRMKAKDVYLMKKFFKVNN